MHRADRDRRRPGPVGRLVPGRRERDFGLTFGLAVDGSKVVIGDTVDVTLDSEAVLNA
ncbi:hypothetical protein [Amycolatopsis sp. NPDC003731]